MRIKFSRGSYGAKLKDQAKPFIYENRKLIIQFIFTIFFLAIGIWFIRQERSELFNIGGVIRSADSGWLITGFVLVAVYILLQGLMYVFSFRSIKCDISLKYSTILFIKRNFISVFLPAGGISSLAFFTGPIEKKGVKESQIHFASSIYAFVGILSVVIVAIPAFIYALWEGTIGSGDWYALIAVILLVFLLVYIYRSIVNKGFFYKILVKYIPTTEVFVNDLQNNMIDRKSFLFTILTSVVIELVGIAHLYVAMMALNFHPHLLAVVLGYIISVIFLIISPFLRGLGAVEVSMTYVLIRFGFTNVQALAITLLYRFFEFWMPLFVGILTFVSRLNKLFIRVFPAFLLFMLGIINLVSVLTPAISERLTLLKDFLPVQAIHASNQLVLVAGLLLLGTSAFLLRGFRTAWWFAVVLSAISLIGHITKAIDFEEASVALVALLVLIKTRKEYYIKANPKTRNLGLQAALLTAIFTILYGLIGFYFLDKRHFNIDFNFLQSMRYTLQNFVFIRSDDLVPYSVYARDFLISINVSGLVSIVFLVYAFVRAYIPTKSLTKDDIDRISDLVKRYGRSPLDYFKTLQDKMVFFSKSTRAFIAYRISGNFAVILENPVAENEDEFIKCVVEFDKYCFENGMKSIYYRVPEESLKLYRQLHKKELFIGQEGVVDLNAFSLDGGARKPMRNAINKVVDRGYKSTIHEPPVKDGTLQKIKAVSDEWLKDTGRSEIIFSQGMFIWEELKKQTIITVESPEEKVIAFLNIIPDYAPDEGTYDLIRKTQDAPNGVIDFILIELFKYLESRNVSSVNMGFAPLSGIDDPHTFPERSMKFAYEKIRSFAQYKGLREYKDKFTPRWCNKYLIYQHDYDLLQIPTVLSNVIKP